MNRTDGQHFAEWAHDAGLIDDAQAAIDVAALGLSEERRVRLAAATRWEEYAAAGRVPPETANAAVTGLFARWGGPGASCTWTENQ